MRRFFGICFGMVFSMHFAAVAEDQVGIDEAFVAYATADYFPILEVLIDSVHAFSTKPIVVFGVNADLPFSSEKYPRLIKRRLNIVENPNIFHQKPRVILESQIRYGIYVEADDILNEGVDQLFEECRNVETHPLCPLHVSFVNNQQGLMQALGVTEKSMGYVHGHVIFSEKCLPFIKEWYDVCCHYGHLAENHDETVLNVLLWKYGAKNHLDLYDPFYLVCYDYLKNDQFSLYSWIPDGCQFKKGDNYNVYMFHGCKNPAEARKLLNRLIEKSKNFIEIGSEGKIACRTF